MKKPSPNSGTEQAISKRTRIKDHFQQKAGGLHLNTIGALWILLAAFLFTIMSVLIKTLGENHSVFQILFIRQITMLLIVTPGIVKGLPNTLKTQKPKLQIARIVLATAAMVCGFTAVIELPLAEATTISFSKTLFVTVLAIVFLHETVGIHRWIATLIGFVGVLIMMKPEGAGFVDIYALLAFVSAGAAACVMIILRILTRYDEPRTILTYQAFFVGLIFAGPAYYVWVTPTPFEWVLLIALGIVSWAAQSCNIRAFRAGEPTAIASLDYTKLLYATIFGAVLFNEWPSIDTLIGASLIILAALYIIHREAVLRKQLARAPEGRGYTT
ncbi:MAG: DMT family transporter [Rhodobacteraceae bacterium]|nr:DMT family transporter [Paracoccaceae bacterium]